MSRPPAEIAALKGARRIAYGAMALTMDGVPRAAAVDVLHGVLDLGVTLIDTADSYCLDERDPHQNERLVAAALDSYRGDASAVCVATKGGTVRLRGRWLIDGSPERLHRAIRASHEALGGARPIALWQHHWPDPRFAVRESLGAARRALDEGLVCRLGVSNYSVAQIREARDVVPVASVSNQYNLWCRDPERDGVLEYCEREGLAFLPWRPLGGRGLAGRLAGVAPLAAKARERGISVWRLVTAWLLARSDCIRPIPGGRRLEQVADLQRATEVNLTPAEVRRISGLSARELPAPEVDPRPRLALGDLPA